MSADLRSAIRSACDIADELNGEVHSAYGEMNDDAERRISDLRAIADAPLNVGEALRDPRVRAGTHVIERTARPEWVRQYRVQDGDVQTRTRTVGEAAWRAWGVTTLCIGAMDAICRLIPAPTEAP